MTPITDFLHQLHQAGIEVWDDGGYMGYQAAEGVLTPEILSEMKERKREILQFLRMAADSHQLTTISPSGHANSHPLSFAQERFWFASQLHGNDGSCNIPTAFRLNGQLQVAALEKSLQTIVERHESLRTTFVLVPTETSSTQERSIMQNGATENSELVQWLGQPNFVLAHADLTQLAGTEQERELHRLLQTEAQRPFDLTGDLMLRATLIQLAPTEYALLLVVHHIASDGWSINLLLREVEALYFAFCQGNPSPLPALQIQYTDYVVWQRQWVQSQEALAQRDYWLAQLQNSVTLDLPTDRPRPVHRSNRGASHEFTLSAAVSDGLRALSRAEDCTLFITLLATWQVLLHRYSGQSEILVGATIAGRNRIEVEPLIGLFINNLIYRSGLSGDLSFRQMLQTLRQTAISAYSHPEYPFDRLINDLHLPRNSEHSPFAQVRFAFHPKADQQVRLTLPDIQVRPIPLTWEYADFDLNLMVWEMDETLTVKLAYSTDLFDAATIARMAGHWQILLEGALANPARPIAQLPLLTVEERQQILSDWNQTTQSLPLDRPFHTHFAAQAAKTPTAIAAVANHQFLTYAELNERSNQLAHLLVEQGVRRGVVVALFARRGLDFLTAMLAIFKVGGVYLPLEPRNPVARHRQMLQQSQAALLLYADEFQWMLGELQEENPVSLVMCSLEHSLGQLRSKENPSLVVDPTDIAYVIFTSGSTGIPKGAMVEHRGMLNHLYAKVHDLALSATDRIAQTAPQSFDISVWQFLAALLVGGTVHIYSDEVAFNPIRLLGVVREDKISIWETVPSLMRAMIEGLVQNDHYRLPALRWLIPTGEALPPQLANQWLSLYPQIPLLNAYGPTECSDDVTHYPIHQPLPAVMIHTPIGRPIVNMRAYILDGQMQPLPIGIPGELWIGGVGVGRGYIHDVQRTVAAFMPDPFSPESDARLYKTGDRACYLPDGNIEFLGRLDYQVKIRGHRIELGEIESALLHHPAVRECLVTVQEDETEQTFRSLVAYLVTSDDSAQPAILRDFLKQKLPDYMVPAFFIFLKAMPLTAHGKIDRHALPPPNSARTMPDTPFTEPTTPLEHYLAERWQQVLKITQIGVHDNVFEHGCDSIRAAIFINQLQQHFQEVVYVTAVFDAPTIRKQAVYLQQHYPLAVARISGVQVDTHSVKSTNHTKVDDAMLQEFRLLISPLLPAHPPRTYKNRKAIFVLSAPRSGSTLFRVMLGGHPQLFSPPELNLLGFNTLRERAEALSGRFSFHLEGLIRAVMELLQCDADAAKARLGEMEAMAMPMQDFYHQLQNWIGNDRLLVDKTPIYALDPQTLRRAEEYFDEVYYIHLLRHPAAMIRSFEEAHTDQVFLRQVHPFSARQLAELVWTVSNQTIRDFLTEIPAHRQHRVRYEDLVKEPQTQLQTVCQFLQLNFHPNMAQPYLEKEKRMTDGIHQVSKMLGDPKFHTYGQIDPNTADRWRQYYTEDFIGEPTWQLAEAFGYQSPISQGLLSIPRVMRQRQRIRQTAAGEVLAVHPEYQGEKG